MDEVICTKADKTLLTEFKDFSERSFSSKTDNAQMKQHLESSITDFT